MDIFRLSYLTYWQPLLLLTTHSLLKCSFALISLTFDSCSQHTAISGCLFSFSITCSSSWIIVKGVREGLGGTVILTLIVFICFSHRAWDQLIDNSKNLFAWAFTSFFFQSLIFRNFTIQLKWWNRTVAVWLRESVTKTTRFPYPSPTHSDYSP